MALCQPETVFLIRGHPINTPSVASTSIAQLDAETTQPASISNVSCIRRMVIRKLAKAELP